MTIQTPDASQLGKKTHYQTVYNPDLLFPIPRQTKRAELGIVATELPFYGRDQWRHFEVSWLNKKGKPVVGVAHIEFNCHSTHIIESKSMKLYFNSLNDTQFEDERQLETIIKHDLEARVLSEVMVMVIPLATLSEMVLPQGLAGHLLDNLDIECNTYTVNPALLMTQKHEVTETLCSNLLKSNCLVTGQPDWGSIQITYQGNQIQHENLLRYIVSFRHHTEFGEHCIERIFMDILTQCRPKQLTVLGSYTRRGGISIDSYRSTEQMRLESIQLYRQ
jgi:7-cyano-7-deazaguanine reductase